MVNSRSSPAAQLLIVESGMALTHYTSAVLEVAKGEWTQRLAERTILLQQYLHHTTNDMEYGGAGSLILDVEPLEAAVDEARRAVCALEAEVKKRRECAEAMVWERRGVEAVCQVDKFVSAGV
ncbi:hypothetical protein DB88DRAFT_537123 [Papiliotrema laurentii]|uniref:Uncharacterized protein n=1 Tax=Papiliotrema laurentii TaxID=5418 RepID=A0AAD9L939_PAPLA|nr:hypothetical protein DB88DRAFT_537123 [Papiliotrema laurentii]